MSQADPDRPIKRYAAFGLCIESDLGLPELELDRSDRVCDLRIVRRKVPTLLEGEVTVAFSFQDHEASFSWRDVGDFRILGHDLIEYWPRPGVNDSLVNLPLLGPVMGVFLQRRGLLTLHGSAVALSSGVAVFLGDKGAGKSTTAACLVRSGKALLTDDIVAIDCRTSPLLYPAYPQVKLTNEASASINVSSNLMPSPHPELEKRLLRLTAPFSLMPRRPTAAFVLERGSSFEIHRLDGVSALKALFRYSYATRFGRSLIAGASATAHLHQCAALSRQIAVFRLVVPNDLASLADLPAWLEEQVGAVESGLAA